MGFKDYILQLDIIGKAPTLYINNQLSVKTFVGSVFSLFVIVVSLAYLVYQPQMPSLLSIERSSS